MDFFKCNACLSHSALENSHRQHRRKSTGKPDFQWPHWDKPASNRWTGTNRISEGENETSTNRKFGADNSWRRIPDQCIMREKRNALHCPWDIRVGVVATVHQNSQQWTPQRQLDPRQDLLAAVVH
ncbi:hypothetical protein RP20_CCG006103 [Aedes albopictus]|nr:hypothetical protein RP20_CCG006103 [Aedes albopictus]